MQLLDQVKLGRKCIPSQLSSVYGWKLSIVIVNLSRFFIYQKVKIKIQAEYQVEFHHDDYPLDKQ